MDKTALTFDRLFRDHLRGGRADFKPDRVFKKKQLAKGTKHEREHTVDPAVAKEIAKDHLAEDPDYYDMLDKLEQQASKKAADTVEKKDQSGEPDMTANTTTNLTRQDLPFSRFTNALDSVVQQLADLQAKMPADSGDGQEQGGQQQAIPMPADKPDENLLRELQDLEVGLRKLIDQRQYATRDELSADQVAALQDHDLLTRPGASSKHPNVPATSFTDESQGAMSSTSGAKAAAATDLLELRAAMFFEGLSDALLKHGQYVEHPLEFFAGCYDSLRSWFEPGVKVASAGYPEYAANACRLFMERQEQIKQAAFGGMQPIKPLAPLGGGAGGQAKIPDPAESAMKNVAMDPNRMARRQDLIDEMLPQAESIQLDPDGGIKLKMPDPMARAMKMQDAKIKQMQQVHQLSQSQQAPQQPQLSDAGQLPAGDSSDQQGAGAGQGMQGDTAGSPMAGGGSPDAAALLRQMMGAQQ